DYGPKGSVFAPFFSVPQAATTNGTYVLSRLSGAKMLSISMVRKLDRRGYSLHISEVMNDYPGEDKQIAAGYINKVIEREILRAPEQYL
ncbi:kdo(2)-lipid IV(A) palmitoleoyltransferase, partial [Acinetobacter baumannii]|nr:kdo(2)-lipid IV(A) palmitoleoyltransferase [Acinetobacter baumannii]